MAENAYLFKWLSRFLKFRMMFGQSLEFNRLFL